MKTTAVAGSIVVASAIVPTIVNPNPARPLMAPATRTTIAARPITGREIATGIAHLAPQRHKRWRVDWRGRLSLLAEASAVSVKHDGLSKKFARRKLLGDDLVRITEDGSLEGVGVARGRYSTQQLILDVSRRNA